MNLKEKLLNLQIVEDNEYLNRYCELVERNKDNQIGERHHILPRFYFRYNNLEIDNSEENIVILSKDNHILAHKLLFQCGKNYFKFYNGYTYANMSPEEIELFNENNKPRKAYPVGKVLIFKDNVAKKIPKENLQEYLDAGWVRGMFYRQYTYNGETHNVYEWSKIFNLPINKARRKLTYIKTRKLKTYTYNGETHTYDEWCKIIGISRCALENRINSGWDIYKRIDKRKEHIKKWTLIKDDLIMHSIEFNQDFGTIDEFCKQFGCNKDTLKKNIYKGKKTFGSHWVLI